MNVRPELTEKEWLELVVQYARLQGWWCYHTFDSRKSEAGLPDLILLRPPEMMVAELKSARGKVTQAQHACITAFKGCGIEAYVWRPADEKMVFERLAKKGAA